MYKTVYNLAGGCFSPTDIEQILDFAINFQKGVPSISDINLYVPTQGCIGSILAGVNCLKYGIHSFSYKGVSGNIYTPRSYKSGGVSQSEILIALCVDNNILRKVESSSSIVMMLVVPEMMSACEYWLQVHSATNLVTKKEIPNNLSVSPLANRVIGWLKDQSVMGASLSHITMESYIKDGFNVLYKNGVKVSYDSILKQCLLRGLSHSDSYVVAKFMNATALYKPVGRPDYDYMLKWIDDAKWDSN